MQLPLNPNGVENKEEEEVGNEEENENMVENEEEVEVENGEEEGVNMNMISIKRITTEQGTTLFVL
jgi:hypothetical protein